VTGLQSNNKQWPKVKRIQGETIVYSCMQIWAEEVMAGDFT